MTLAPSPPVRLGRWDRVRAPILTVAGLSAATLALHVRDPHDKYSWGFCPSSQLGVYCPGCGGLRAVNDLTHGDLGAAASSNLLLVVAMPFLVLALGLWVVDSWRGAPSTIRWARLKPFLPAALVVVTAFTVLRNLGVGAWLAP